MLVISEKKNHKRLIELFFIFAKQFLKTKMQMEIKDNFKT
jgi:hypothetical protein